jgi:thiol-disulfide isomerase/thioredoxin
MMLISLGIGLVLALILIGTVTSLTSSTTTTTLVPAPIVGKQVAGFREPGLTGGTVTSPWTSGHPSVVIFFASFCTPCREELPRLAGLAGNGVMGNVRVIGIAANDVASAAAAFTSRAHVRFPVAFDGTGAITTGHFGFETIPETVFINAKGIVTSVLFGSISSHAFLSGVTALR